MAVSITTRVRVGLMVVCINVRVLMPYITSGPVRQGKDCVYYCTYVDAIHHQFTCTQR